MELCASVLCRPSCNPFVKDPLEDSEILHSGEDRDVEQWLEPWNNSFVFTIACVLLSITFYISYLSSCLSCLIPFLAFHSLLSLLVYTHLNNEAIEHFNSLSRGIKEEKF